jgi:quercetin dioxygenase-like cupin family protein
MATIHRFNGTEHCFDWENVRSIQYDSGAAKGVTGRILIGSDEQAPYFVFRYFHVAPGGHSMLNDYHAHDHGVLILHGRALVNVEGQEFELNPMDVIHIQSWEHHSLSTIGDQPMGFLCVIANKDLLRGPE